MGFKPKDVDSIRLDKIQDVSFNKEQFIEDVLEDEYILTIGSEVVLDRSVEPSGDVCKYLLDTVNSFLKTDYATLNDLERHYGNGDDPVRNLLTDTEHFEYDLSDIEPSLRNLLGQKLFPIVLTTTFDGYVEALMKSIWGERLRVVNIVDRKSVQEFRTVLKDYGGQKRYIEPTLIYIFGKATQDESKNYVRTDEDAIRIIEKWMSFPQDDPIIKLIRGRKMLSLGCKYENWYFRFFWYILRHETMSFKEGQVAFVLNEGDNNDSRLKNFMSQTRIYCHGDARNFMNSLSNDLSSTSPENPFWGMILKKRRKGGVFLSHCGSDMIAATSLFLKLTRDGYSVWFDSVSLRGGDNYEQRIAEAIKDSPVFIALLSNKVRADILAGKTDEYYMKEWRLAGESHEKGIFPVSIEDYNFKMQYHLDGFQRMIGLPLNCVPACDIEEKCFASFDDILK